MENINSVAEINQKKPLTIASMLSDTKFKKQVALALPKHMTPDRFTRLALTEVRKNPKLALCTPASFASAMMNLSQTGLELGSIFGQAYLIPYKTECQLIIGYRGMIELAYRSGKIININAEVVREGDEFEYEFGMNTMLRHKPKISSDDTQRPVKFVYSCAKLVNGGFQFTVMTKKAVDQIRSTSKSEHIWSGHYEEMAKKTALRRLFKMLPVSAEIVKAMAIHDAQEMGETIDISPLEIDNEQTFESDQKSSELAEVISNG